MGEVFTLWSEALGILFVCTIVIVCVGQRKVEYILEGFVATRMGWLVPIVYLFFFFFSSLFIQTFDDSCTTTTASSFLFSSLLFCSLLFVFVFHYDIKSTLSWRFLLIILLPLPLRLHIQFSSLLPLLHPHICCLSINMAFNCCLPQKTEIGYCLILLFVGCFSIQRTKERENSFYIP